MQPLSPFGLREIPTRPGFHPEFSIRSYPDVLWPAIHALADSFFLTRGFKPALIGKSEYFAVLARPIDEISININTDQEIVIVVTAYSNFDIRTIESFDQFYGALESKRVDKGIRFVISADTNVERTVHHFLDQNPEYLIIIPITFDDLIRRKRDSILQSVRNNYVLRDLFGFQNPLHEDTFFFGRHSTVNRVLDMARSGQNSSLFGLRKSGKTSTIYAIMRRSKSVGVNCVMIDCQDPIVHSQDYSGLLSYIVSEVRKSLGMKKLSVGLGENIKSVSENFRMHMTSIIGTSKANYFLSLTR
ncbi:hypothetical protein [Phreatobacter oligotrophus]|uniref:hypothetical protein n=1 Tax=Phreatobacter oligotrophus TaxID=1122261 RepID=UPI00235634EB|nr:hypothetical protein [Phreatobacter oligotrophus]MBX9989530.1 hypothetical protein [Phreatobacter oligotrophus]